MTDVADLAGRDQLVQRRQRFLDRGERVRLVQLVQVDPVGVQPPQRGLHRGPDVPPRSACAEIGAIGARRVHAELGGHHHVITATAEGDAQQFLAAACGLTVDVGGVEQGDAGIERGVDHRAGSVQGRRRGPRPPEIVAAEPGGGDRQPGMTEAPESPVHGSTHGCTVRRRTPPGSALTRPAPWCGTPHSALVLVDQQSPEGRVSLGGGDVG